MSLKKVLFVSSLYSPNIGGIERFIDEFSVFLKEKNIHSIVLTKRYPHDLAEYEILNGTEIVRIKRPITEQDYAESAQILEKYENILKSDIIHVIGTRRPLPIFAAWLSKKWKIPYVVTFAGADVPSPSYVSAWQDWLLSKEDIEPAIMKAHWKVAFSRDLVMNARYCMPKLLDVDVIYAGLNLDRIKKAPQHQETKQYILCTARLIYAKGIDILIKAFAELVKIYQQYQLFIIGNGPELNFLQALANDLNITHKISFLGEKSLDEVYSFIKGAECVVVPSREEGGGTINIEIQSCKTFVIASDAGGIPEYVSLPNGGTLFKTGNVEDLLNKLVSFLDNQDKFDIESKVVKEFIATFSWNVIGNQYIQGYNQAIENYYLDDFSSWNNNTSVLSKLWDV